MSRFSLLIVILSICLTGRAEEFAPLFPFVVSHDAPANITNVTNWADPSWHHAPAGKHGFIRIENGKFVHDAGRFLIWGSNTCFTANFPEKERAEKVAARLTRLGVNCVRLHHMDSRDIWGGSGAKSQLTIDPEQLDKLDYYIYQLKRHGIYVNINLHVSRNLDDRDGFPGKDRRPKQDKGVDNFYPPMVEAAKKYARDLLLHVNPYTKTAYREETAVAMIEINNENSIVSQWAWNREVLTMPDPYAADFKKRWNDFLRKKYKTDAALKKAWNTIDQPMGDEMLKVGLESNKWNAEVDSETKCIKSQAGDVFRFKIERMGKVAWRPQLIAHGLKFEKGKPYTFSIRARADKPRELSMQNRMSHDPWNNLGFSARMALTTEWKTFTFTFVSSEDSEKARFDIANFAPGEFEFADASLRPGGTVGLKSDWSIETGTVPIMWKSSTPKEAVDDFCEFVFELEDQYWTDFYRFLKDEIKVRQPVSGTQLRYGSTHAQAKLDYIDNHAYWNHPVFPGRPWDGNNWYIRNRALVNHADESIFATLGTARVHGLPYTVSEFDSPMPNQYAAEALPMLAAFGRFQDWDGIFHFAYSHSKEIYETEKATSFFDMVGNTVKLAHMPACAAMFRRGDVAEGKELITAGFTPEQELEIFKRERGVNNFTFKGLGLDPRLTLAYRTALDLSGQSPEKIPVIPEDLGGDALGTKQFELWQDKDRSHGTFVVDTPNAVLFTGFTSRPTDTKDLCVEFSSVKLEFPRKSRLGWKTVSMVSVNGNGFEPKGAEVPANVLVTATGLMQNTDMEIEKLDGDKITFGRRWGNEPVLCEGIPMTLEFTKAKSVRCWPLDGNGNRREEIKADGNTVKLGPEYKTIWYEIELH